MEKTTAWLRPSSMEDKDAGHKPGAYLPVYEEFLEPLRNRPFTLLELGVWKGASLLMWAENFPLATIVGVDVKLPKRASWPSNVHLHEGNQADPRFLKSVAELHAPEGFDAIIDDASHVADLTCVSLDSLFIAHLRSGGLYFIEDWGTGYWPHWPDGNSLSAPLILCDTPEIPNRESPLQMKMRGALNRLGLAKLARQRNQSEFSSGHEGGMISLIKRLVDHVGSGDIPEKFRGKPLPIAAMSVFPGLTVLKKK